MQQITVNGVRLAYQEFGRGPETLVLAHGLLMSSHSYREQLRALSDRYRVIAYDHRGHGASARPRSGYDMDTIAEDAAQLIERVARGPVHFAGLSMGGFVGLRLAARRPHLLKSLTLLATSADAHDGSTTLGRIVTGGLVRRVGFGPIARIAATTMYGRTHLRDPRAREAAEAYVKRLPRSLWRPMTAVIERPGVAHELARITVPTLVVVGDEDTLLPPAHALRLAKGIPGAELLRIPRTGHLITDENPAAATDALRSFLGRVTDDERRFVSIG